jgi:chemotaxis regulatin CheY-phosphate phosphatase CheZ
MDLLPLEGHPQEAEAALLETPLFTPSSEVLPQWEEFWQQLLQVAAQADAGVATNLPRPDYRADAQTQDSLMKVDRIIGSLSRITEALAFQDLSGQRLLKVMNLLRQLQVQVLTLLVAAGTKLKIKMDQQELSLKEHEILAQEELDRLLHTLATPVAPELGDPEGLGKISSTDDQPLDQDSVNDLLNSMGF